MDRLPFRQSTPVLPSDVLVSGRVPLREQAKRNDAKRSSATWAVVLLLGAESPPLFGVPVWIMGVRLDAPRPDGARHDAAVPSNGTYRNLPRFWLAPTPNRNRWE